MRARIRTTPQAEAQALAAATWWRTNRLAAPDLFTDELAGALDSSRVPPRSGIDTDTLAFRECDDCAWCREYRGCIRVS